MKITSNNTIPLYINNTPSKTMNIAQEFESIFTSMMIKSMRKTIFEDGLIPKSISEKIYTDMLDQEYSKIITKNSSFGLAEQIVQQIENSNNKSLITSLQGIGRNPWMIDPRFIPNNIRGQTTSSILNKISKYDSIIDEASRAYKLDRNLITAVIAQESAGNPFARSQKGAKGLMQLIDSTAKAMGVSNVYNPRENIMGGSKYLKQMLTQNNGDQTLALASYNAGPGAVEKYNGVPPYKETQNYIRRVTTFKENLELKETTISANQNKD